MPSQRFRALAALGGLLLLSACEASPDNASATQRDEDVDDAIADGDAVENGSQGTGRAKPGGSTAKSEWQPPRIDECGEGPLSYEGQTFARTPKPDWAEGAKIPLTGRPNLYGYSGQEFIDRIRQGKIYTVDYPVSVTASWMPIRLMEKVFKADENPNPFTQLAASINPISRFKDFADFEDWLGLHPFPDCDGKGGRSIPFPNDQRPTYAMGSSRHMEADGPIITYSCAGCHASQLFGRSILGLQNRKSRANAGIEEARGIMAALPADFIGFALGATPGETRQLRRLQEGFAFVGTKKPMVLGLDTSLAQVAISLAKRDKDPYATRNPAMAQKPRPERLTTNPVDSKPGNWWVLKYKNRWLLDGSVVSGNPVYTNLLWNEIGRGTDLHQLEKWLDENQQVVDDITAAVFSVEAPRISEFLPVETVDIEAAKRGKKLFDGQCASCHGQYDKAWDLPNAASLTMIDRLTTTEVRYHETTPVVDVGTDSLRNRGMDSLVQLNDLSISIKSGVVIKPQTGYVPPPLVGIWARYPYFHNNSAPSLCAVLTRAEDRPKKYYGGPQDDPKRDFDEACNGYPSGDKVPDAWLKNPEALYDTAVPSLGNQGHDEGVFLKEGKEIFTPEQKRDIIEFLQTL